MDNILSLVLLVLVGGIAMISLLAVIKLMFPQPAARTSAIIESSMGRSFLLGLVNFLFAGALVFVFVRLAQDARGPLAAILFLLAVTILLFLTVIAALGLTGLTSLVGERMGEGATPFRMHLRGSLLVLLAGLTPYIGWFAFSPLAVITGFGAALQAVLRGKEKTSV